MKTALQLYTVRAYLEEDFSGTLRRVREAGYTYVERDKFYGRTAEEFRAGLDKAGLKAVSAHVGMAELLQTDQLRHDLDVLGAKQAVVPGLPNWYCRTPEGMTAAAQRMAETARVLAEDGVTLSYHNHCHEFDLIGAAFTLQYLLNTDPIIHLQLDLGHCRAAGEDPAAWLKRYKNRIVSVHAKDVNFDIAGDRHDTVIGKGLVDWPAAFSVLRDSTCEYVIVEHEHMPTDIFEDIRASHEYLEGLLG